MIALASQSRRFVAYEVRILSTKKEALQALSIPKNLTRNPLTFRSKEIGESVDRTASLLLRPLTLQQTLQSGDLASGQWIVGVSKASMDLGYQ
jgi:hypothetical protein